MEYRPDAAPPLVDLVSVARAHPEAAAGYFPPDETKYEPK
jgi:hypothetical protein